MGKNFLVGNFFESKKNLSEILFGLKKNLGRNFCRSKKIWVGNLVWPNSILVGNFVGSKKIRLEISLDRNLKNLGKQNVAQKNLGRIFGLAKFYFGLLRFVCVMLLVTAKLNNNNTEFHSQTSRNFGHLGTRAQAQIRIGRHI